MLDRTHPGITRRSILAGAALLVAMAAQRSFELARSGRCSCGRRLALRWYW